MAGFQSERPLEQRPRLQRQFIGALQRQKLVYNHRFQKKCAFFGRSRSVETARNDQFSRHLAQDNSMSAALYRPPPAAAVDDPPNNFEMPENMLEIDDAPVPAPLRSPTPPPPPSARVRLPYSVLPLGAGAPPAVREYRPSWLTVVDEVGVFTDEFLLLGPFAINVFTDAPLVPFAPSGDEML